MAGKKISGSGSYQNEKQAERTVNDLMAAGFAKRRCVGSASG